MFCCAPAVSQDDNLVDTEAVAAQEEMPEEPKVEESAKCFDEAPEEPAPEPAQPPEPEPVLEVFPRTFEATIKRAEGKKFGSQCIRWTDRVEVTKVAPDGDLEEYNKGAAEEVQVKAGDFIVKVKCFGQSEEQQIPQAMMDALKTGGDLIVTLVKPFRFDVEVTKDGPLGLQLQHTNQTAGIVIGEIKDHGPFKAYNEALDATEPRRVKAKDCIDLVNGERTQTGAELADKIKAIEKGSNIKISFIRFLDA